MNYKLIFCQVNSVEGGVCTPFHTPCMHLTCPLPPATLFTPLLSCTPPPSIFACTHRDTLLLSPSPLHFALLSAHTPPPSPTPTPPPPSWHFACTETIQGMPPSSSTTAPGLHKAGGVSKGGAQALIHMGPLPSPCQACWAHCFSQEMLPMVSYVPIVVEC